MEQGKRLNWRKNREPAFEVVLSMQDVKRREVSEQEVQEGPEEVVEEAEHLVSESELR